MLWTLYFILPLLVWFGFARFVLGVGLTIGEIALQFFATIAIITSVYFITLSAQTSDSMMVHGHVTKLEPIRKTCNTYWSDFSDSFCTNEYTRTVPDGKTCSRDKDGKETCVTKYKTQYKSVYPWERRYFVRTTLSSYEISRVDKQGVNTPPRFAEIDVGEPVTEMASFTNYIKAASATVIGNMHNAEPLNVAYPHVHDYYRVLPVIDHSGSVDKEMLGQLSDSIRKVNRDIAPVKGNVVVVITSEGEDFAKRLEYDWQAFKYNDVVVTLGMTAETVNWVNVKSWSKDQLNDVVLRDTIREVGLTDSDSLQRAMTEAILQHYVMPTEEDFEYLYDDIEPPMAVNVIIWIIMLIVTPAITFILSRVELFTSSAQISRIRIRPTSRSRLR
jgi:hypothetical protein